MWASATVGKKYVNPKWVKLDGGRGSGSKCSLVLTESAGNGDRRKGPRLLGYPERSDGYMELKDREGVRTFMGQREEPDQRSSLQLDEVI